MHGVWRLGHPLHPALTDIPQAAWFAAGHHCLGSCLGLSSPMPLVRSTIACLRIPETIQASLAHATSGYVDVKGRRPVPPCDFALP